VLNFQCHVRVELTIASEPNSCTTSATKFVHNSKSSIIKAISKMDRMVAAVQIIAVNILDKVGTREEIIVFVPYADLAHIRDLVHVFVLARVLVFARVLVLAHILVLAYILDLAYVLDLVHVFDRVGIQVLLDFAHFVGTRILFYRDNLFGSKEVRSLGVWI
jgi:hypothetical protein